MSKIAKPMHTPGPWQVDTNGTAIQARSKTMPYPATANVYYPSQLPETRANARLIAAAPEMAEALHSAHAHSISADAALNVCNLEQAHLELEAIREFVEAALKKAGLV